MRFADLSRLPQRAPRATLAIAAALTLILGTYAARFQVDSAVDQLLPEADAEGAYYEGVRRLFGSEEIAVIGVFTDDVFRPRTLERIDRLTRALAALPGVEEVTSLTDVERVTVGTDGLGREALMPPLPHSPADSRAFRARALADRVVQRALVSPDARAAALWVRFAPMPDAEFLARGLADRIRAVIAETPGDEAVAITGLPTIKVEAARHMLQDLSMFLPLALLLVTGMLIWAFRTWRGVLLPLATLVIGVVWTTGIMVATGHAFTMGTLVLPPMLMAVGIAYAIHVVTRYYLELRRERSSAEAVAAAVEHVRLPVAMAALTTFIGFATFVWSPIPSIRDFGVFAGLGIAVIFVGCIALIPAALTLLPAPAAMPTRLEEGGQFARFVVGCGTLSIRYRWIFLALFGCLLALGTWGITRIRVETDYLGFFSPTSPVRIENARIGRALAGTQVLSVVIDGTRPESISRVDTVTAIAALQRFIESQDGIDKTLSLVDHLERVRRSVTPERAAAPLTEQGEVDQLLTLLAPRDLRYAVDPALSRANIVVHTRLSGSREMADFIARVDAYAEAHLPPDVRLHTTGTVVLLNRSADALAWSQVVGDGQVMVILLLLMTLLFRSLRLGLLSMVPNVVPIVMLLGIMGWTGIDLNICTSTIASISIGIAIDDTIHYMLGYHDMLRTGASREAAILSTLRGVGRPILIAATTLASGFLIACVSNFQPVRDFGLLSSLTLVIATLTELFLLPALLITLRVGHTTAGTVDRSAGADPVAAGLAARAG
jgi:uncharacterized protein